MAYSQRLVYIFLLCCVLAVYTSAQTTARILIYSRTAGFRHDSIPTAIDALKAKGSSVMIEFDNTEDPAQFTDATLSKYDALLFLSTTGEVLDSAGKSAFQKYLNLGGNFIGVHSATDTLRNDTFYEREIGALFDYHANLQNATVDVIDSSHPSTIMLPSEWKVQDEMYNFESDPRTLGATVVLSANESSYVDSGTRKFNQGTPHPLAWFQTHAAGVEVSGTAGRSFYTSLGHLNETWQDDLFLSHVLGGISWVLQANMTQASNSSGLVGNSGSSSSASSSVSLTPTLGSSSPLPTTSSSGAMTASSFTGNMARIILMNALGLLSTWLWC